MVLFSPDIFAAQTTGGISRCMIELMHGLSTGGYDWRLWAGSNGNGLLKSGAASFSDHLLSFRYLPRASRASLLLSNEVGFAQAVRRRPFDVVHRTYYPVLDLIPRGSRRQVGTLHDLWDERAGSEGGRMTRLRSFLKHRALARADAIVCVSDHTRDELIDVWPSLAGRAVVIPHGVRRLSDRPHFVYTRPFFIFVGKRGSYKNFATAVMALRCSRLSGHDLVCFGGGAFTDAERRLIAEAGVTTQVHHTEGSDDRLAGAYEQATALLYPSSYEGFGLPLLEAMIHNCPVIAAPLTSLPAVGGSAALYADPREPDAWAETMMHLADDLDFAESCRQRGRDQAAAFSWEATAAAHIQIYAQVSS